MVALLAEPPPPEACAADDVELVRLVEDVLVAVVVVDAAGAAVVDDFAAFDEAAVTGLNVVKPELDEMALIDIGSFLLARKHFSLTRLSTDSSHAINI